MTGTVQPRPCPKTLRLGGSLSHSCPPGPIKPMGKVGVSPGMASVDPAGSVPWLGVPSPASPRSWGVPKKGHRVSPVTLPVCMAKSLLVPVRGAGGKWQLSAALQGRLCKPGIKSSPCKFPLGRVKRDSGGAGSGRAHRPVPSPVPDHPPPAAPQKWGAGDAGFNSTFPKPENS